MSRKRDEQALGPQASAGLLRFFQDEAHGVKVRPELVIISGVALIIVCILAHVMYPGLL